MSKSHLQSSAAAPRGRLFRKYVALLVALVSMVLLVNGAIDIWFSYADAKSTLVRLQREKAEAAAQRIEGFVAEIERQIGWTTHAQWAAGAVESRRFDYIRLLRQVPAITELVQLDGQGREQLKVSRLAMDVIASGIDWTSDPRWIEAQGKPVWFSPVYFRKESEPYLSMVVSRSGRGAGYTIAEVNLKLIWDVVSAIRVGNKGYAYVVDAEGRLIAHPDISLVLRNTDLSQLPQVAASRNPIAASDTVTLAEAPAGGGRVLAAFAPIPQLGWNVFVELPWREALAPLVKSVAQTGALLVLGIVVALVASLFLARRLVGPIRLLQAGAARVGSGELDHRIEVRTGDELQSLGETFNTMSEQLQESYAGLERKVAERTRELAQSIGELNALAEVGRAVSSSLDLKTVLTTIVSRAVELGGADAGAIYRYRKSERRFVLAETHGLEPALVERIRRMPVAAAETALGQAMNAGEPLRIADLRTQPSFSLRDINVEAGYRSVLIVPLTSADRSLGAIVLQRREISEFPESAVRLMQTFAAQSALAIQNARLFREIEAKNLELEVASRHKSQFLANMSHELRTPLNAILGYAELLVDAIYGELPEKQREVLERVQSNGRHLLSLINDVLDLAKIEAGQLTLTLEEYSVEALVQNVMAATEPLASAKGLAVSANVAPGLPLGRGDERRLAQVLLNLLGNAIKFTDAGHVDVTVNGTDESFDISVRDTGPGIAEADQEMIFDEFQQVDDSSTRNKGGTGLGLAISKKIVEMHGGRLSVSSRLGEGSVFRIVLPVETTAEMEAA